MKQKPRVLFLCTGNSCRSQMAEGWARRLKAEKIEAYSAGVHPKTVDPRAVRAMAEVGIDISGQRSKTIDALGDVAFDYVVTLCDSANRSCPVLPARTKLVHAAFDDPPALAAHARTDEEAMEPYRRVRDEIRAFVEKLPDSLNASP